jgi:hypothetical protein
MSEFNNRIAAQRDILQVVNDRTQKEELFGLSSKAIDRWTSANQVDPESRLVELIRTASGKLFFLANKSQEQITEEYATVSREISDLCRSIQEEVFGPDPLRAVPLVE